MDSFGIEVSWSTKGSYPGHLLPVDSPSSVESVSEGRVLLSSIAESIGAAIVGTYDLWPIKVDPRSPAFKEAFIKEYLRPRSEAEIDAAINGVMISCLSDVERCLVPFVRRSRIAP
jgi:hypothetical protein